MKVLSLWQPWASAWALQIKKHETRSWPTHYRGPLAIHAAKHPPYNLPPVLRPYLGQLSEPWPVGCIIAVVNLAEVVLADSLKDRMTPEELAWGDYSLGRYIFVPDSVRVLAKPIPFRGRQGLFEWIPKSDDLIFVQPEERRVTANSLTRE